MPSHQHKPLKPSHGSSIYYQGADLKLGAKPTVIYFALSGQMSLYEDPINQPVLQIIQEDIRVFSWDLPFHDFNHTPKEAMIRLAHEFMNHPSFMWEFLDVCQKNLNYLIDEGFIDLKNLAVMGLSRGAFVATHLAAKDNRFKYILGFAPLTIPRPSEELKALSPQTFEKMALNSVVDQLISIKLRFYIGNHDTLVGTDECYSFIRDLTNIAYHNGVRSPTTELIIYPSIGYKGHGTPPSIFRDGVKWLIQQLKS